MAKNKHKNISQPRWRSMPFFAMWVLTHTIGWVAIFAVLGIGFEYAVIENLIRNFFAWIPNQLAELLFYAAFALTPGLIIATGQKLLLRRAYGLRLHGWIIASAIGWATGGIAAFTVPLTAQSDTALLPSVVMMVPLALAQWLILRRHVRQAWVWMLAIVVSGLVWGSVVDSNDGLGFSILGVMLMAGLAGAAQGGVTGTSLLWLLATNQRRTRNLKNDVEATEQEEAGQRLTEKALDPTFALGYTDERAQIEHIRR